MRSKELSVEIQHRIVSKHKSGEGYQNIYWGPSKLRNKMASIILPWKTFGTIKTLPRSGHPAKLSNQGRRALVREVTKTPMVTLTEFL